VDADSLQAVLCDFQGQSAQEIVHAILTRLVGRVGDNPPRLREYVEMLDILATNRDLNLNIKEELEMLTVDIEKLAVYQIGLDRGVHKGIERGIEEGIHIQATAIAKKMLAQGMAAAQIAAITDLPLAEVEALRLKLDA
jgi:predicted transposase YdaD